MVDAVVFDWGGTLTTYVHVDSVSAWRRAARCLDPERADVLCEALAQAEAALWRTVQTEPRSGSLAGLVKTVAAELELVLSASGLDTACKSYLDAWVPHVEHRSDAIEMLSALRRRGIKVGLLSNTLWPGNFHDELLERDGLLELIDVRHYTSDRAWMKPHPDAFAAVLDELGVPAQAAVFVGDRLFDDVFGAQRAGLRTVQLPNPFVPPYDAEPDARIESLIELVTVIDSWRAAPLASEIAKAGSLQSPTATGSARR